MWCHLAVCICSLTVHCCIQNNMCVHVILQRLGRWCASSVSSWVSSSRHQMIAGSVSTSTAAVWKRSKRAAGGRSLRPGQAWPDCSCSRVGQTHVERLAKKTQFTWDNIKDKHCSLFSRRWAGAGEAAGGAVHWAGNRERPAGHRRPAPQVQGLQNSVGDSQSTSWLDTGSSGLWRSPDAAPGSLQHGDRVYISRSLYVYQIHCRHIENERMTGVKRAQKCATINTWTHNYDIYLECKRKTFMLLSEDNLWKLNSFNFSTACILVNSENVRQQFSQKIVDHVFDGQNECLMFALE